MPAAVSAALNGELSLLSPATRTLLQGAAVAGDPFEPELAAAAAGVSEPEAVAAIDELLALELIRDHGRSPSLPLPPPARAQGRLRRCARRLALGRARALRDSARRRAAPQRRRARTTSSTPLATATPRRSRCCARPAVRRRSARRPAPRDGSAPRCGCCPTARRPSSGSSSCWRAPRLSAPTGRLEESRADLVESIRLVPDELVAVRVRLTVACAGVEHMLGRHAESRARIMAALDSRPGSRRCRRRSS